MEPTNSSLSGFIGYSVQSKGILTLPVELGTSPCQHIQSVDFFIVDCLSPYNTILGHPTLNKIRAVTSTYHLLVKFPTIGGIGILKRNQTELREIYEAANKTANIQGIRSSAKAHDETSSTKTPNNTQLVGRSEKVETTKIHNVNFVRGKGGIFHPGVIMVRSIPCPHHVALSIIMISPVPCLCRPIFKSL